MTTMGVSMMQNTGKTLVVLLLAAQTAQAEDGVPLSIPLGNGKIVLEGQATPVIGLAWSEDSLVTALDGGALLEWDLESGRPRSLSPVLDGGLLELEFGAAGALLAAGSGGAWIQDSGRGYPLSGHGAAISAAVFSPDGKQVLTADAAGRVIAWDAVSGGQRWVADLHDGAISAVAWSAGGRRVATAGEDGAVHILDASTGHPRGGGTAAHPGGALAVSWSPQGARLLSGGADGVLRLWSDGASVPLSTGDSGAITAVVWSPDGTQIAAGQGSAVHRLHDEDGWKLDEPLPVGARVTALAWSDDAVLAAGDVEGGVHSWRHGVGPSDSRRGLSSAVTTLAWAEGERSRLLGQGADGKLWSWRGRKRSPIRQDRGAVAAWDSSGRRVVLGQAGGDAWVRLDGATITLDGHTGAVTATAADPDGLLLATAGD
ncbi:MAG: WD40 repeat protein, partial [Myxococcota bacterium]